MFQGHGYETSLIVLLNLLCGLDMDQVITILGTAVDPI